MEQRTNVIHKFHRSWMIVGICLAWSACSLAPVWKYLSSANAAVVTLAALLSIVGAMLSLRHFNGRDRQLSLKWFLLLYLAFAAAFAILNPYLQRHTLNRGSDREDALRIELTAIKRHQYPYDARTFLGNPPTPLPGAMLLATPFFVVGHISWQNFVWLALFFWFCIRFFRYRSTALLFLVVFLLISPSNLNDFVTGGDYLTNFFYLAIALGLFVRSLDGGPSQFVPAAIFLGLTLSSRSIYAVVLLPLLALMLQRTNWRRTLTLFSTVLATATVITVPIFMPNPVTRILRQISENPGKLRYIPPFLHPQWTLPLLGCAVMSLAFLIRMDLRRLFLLLGISTFVILAPPVVMLALHMRKLPFECSYLAISVLPISLWLLSLYERTPEGNLNPETRVPSVKEHIPCVCSALSS